jgi:hypothetical protein
MISEAHTILATTKLPEARTERAYELLTAAVSLADDLLAQSPAATLGKKGGKVTAKRGPDNVAECAKIVASHDHNVAPSLIKCNRLLLFIQRKIRTVPRTGWRILTKGVCRL